MLPWPAFITVTESGRNLEIIQILFPMITNVMIFLPAGPEQLVVGQAGPGDSEVL